MNRLAIAVLVLLSAACATAPAKPLNGHYALFVDTAYASMPAELADFVVTAIQDRLGSVELVADPGAAGSYDAIIIVHFPDTIGSAELTARAAAGRDTNVDASGAPDAAGGNYIAGSGIEGYMTYEILRAGRRAGEGGVRVALPRGSDSGRLARFNATALTAARSLAEDVARKLAR